MFKKLIGFSFLIASSCSFSAYMCPTVEAINESIKNMKDEARSVTATGADGQSRWGSVEGYGDEIYSSRYAMISFQQVTLNQPITATSNTPHPECIYLGTNGHPTLGQGSFRFHMFNAFDTYKGTSSNWSEDGKVCQQSSPLQCEFHALS